MTFKLFNKIVLLVLLGGMVFSSCTKQDSVTLVETEVPIDLGLKMTIAGEEIETNAVAAYCQNDTVEFLIISNKEVHLTFPSSTENFVEGDFVYFTSKNIIDGTSWGYGGQALGEDITGLPGILLITFSDAKISIDSNDGEIVIGNSSGTLYGFDPSAPFPGPNDLLEFPYSMNFTAEIVQESNYCE